MILKSGGRNAVFLEGSKYYVLTFYNAKITPLLQIPKTLTIYLHWVETQRYNIGRCAATLPYRHLHWVETQRYNIGRRAATLLRITAY